MNATNVLLRVTGNQAIIINKGLPEHNKQLNCKP